MWLKEVIQLNRCLYIYMCEDVWWTSEPIVSDHEVSDHEVSDPDLKTP